jgi:hypothetical protein
MTHRSADPPDARRAGTPRRGRDSGSEAEGEGSGPSVHGLPIERRSALTTLRTREPDKPAARQVVHELLQIAATNIAQLSTREPIRHLAQRRLQIVDCATPVTPTPLVQRDTVPRRLDEPRPSVAEPRPGHLGESTGRAREELLALVTGLREGASAKVIRARNVAETQRRIEQLERSATRLHSFQPTMVIGLLQTRAYQRIVFGTPDSHALPEGELEQAVAARTQRQTVLDDRPSA